MACLLYSYAHPDDESFLVAGTSCLYSRQGVTIVLATATLGQKGRRGEPALCSRRELPEVRRKELEEARQLLGIGHVEVFGYQDKELDQAPAEDMRERLTALIRRWRPQVVCTFDPHGLNRHPDHIAISRFTADALSAAADPRYRADLGASHRVQRLLWTPFEPPWEFPEPEPPWPRRPGADFILDIREFAQQKEAALKAHRTQWPSIQRCFFPEDEKGERLSAEVFRQAWGPEVPERPCDDLFAGIG
ncbi:MAG TPA: PIG-L deacetylase family protein [Acidobacteriota bacterium]|nr:PIG-L deacetylase family protein [Acidobacteriota bacterium]